ncbi:hypothetical protein TVAG_260380 [Trichomonas vaginalis G3]|uniref:Uncharacterized protein n=1 Tax=Trichomonas vaginalis (strain ATCC PRA-98 / G3) TaxID=412133 RepID=A2E8X0_TRIV3|nr:transforming growth factor beta regulated gene 1 family protein [Trichomonas vaginalis G3]EAY10952.1 hypothetical protein TVAG_260380 [Trichomonas vaginalis G3]KAI5485508.1 transforming growth factor beta regulated gene 1 family protein [Trichomonas vaginalis G3]|eukprot:XP_001323175.1 hypothetical protein [Trichomonas vaginalis G3]
MDGYRQYPIGYPPPRRTTPDNMSNNIYPPRGAPISPSRPISHVPKLRESTIQVNPDISQLQSWSARGFLTSSNAQKSVYYPSKSKKRILPATITKINEKEFSNIGKYKLIDFYHPNTEILNNLVSSPIEEIIGVKSDRGKLLFLTKLQDSSYNHLLWLEERDIKMYLKGEQIFNIFSALGYLKKEPFCNPLFKVPEYVLSNIKQDGQNFSLVKWKGLNIEYCTIENSEDKEISKLVRKFNEFERKPDKLGDEYPTLDKTQFDFIGKVKPEFIFDMYEKFFGKKDISLRGNFFSELYRTLMNFLMVVKRYNGFYAPILFITSENYISLIKNIVSHAFEDSIIITLNNSSIELKAFRENILQCRKSIFDFLIISPDAYSNMLVEFTRFNWLITIIDNDSSTTKIDYSSINCRSKIHLQKSYSQQVENTVRMDSFEESELDLDEFIITCPPTAYQRHCYEKAVIPYIGKDINSKAMEKISNSINSKLINKYEIIYQQLFENIVTKEIQPHKFNMTNINTGKLKYLQRLVAFCMANNQKLLVISSDDKFLRIIDSIFRYSPNCPIYLNSIPNDLTTWQFVLLHIDEPADWMAMKPDIIVVPDGTKNYLSYYTRLDKQTRQIPFIRLVSSYTHDEWLFPCEDSDEFPKMSEIFDAACEYVLRPTRETFRAIGKGNYCPQFENLFADDRISFKDLEAGTIQFDPILPDYFMKQQQDADRIKEEDQKRKIEKQKEREEKLRQMQKEKEERQRQLQKEREEKQRQIQKEKDEKLKQLLKEKEEKQRQSFDSEVDIPDLETSSPLEEESLHSSPKEKIKRSEKSQKPSKLKRSMSFSSSEDEEERKPQKSKSKSEKEAKSSRSDRESNRIDRDNDSKPEKEPKMKRERISKSKSEEKKEKQEKSDKETKPEKEPKASKPKDDKIPEESVPEVPKRRPGRPKKNNLTEEQKEELKQQKIEKRKEDRKRKKEEEQLKLVEFKQKQAEDKIRIKKLIDQYQRVRLASQPPGSKIDESIHERDTVREVVSKTSETKDGIVYTRKKMRVKRIKESHWQNGSIKRNSTRIKMTKRQELELDITPIRRRRVKPEKEEVVDEKETKSEELSEEEEEEEIPEELIEEEEDSLDESNDDSLNMDDSDKENLNLEREMDSDKEELKSDVSRAKSDRERKPKTKKSIKELLEEEEVDEAEEEDYRLFTFTSNGKIKPNLNQVLTSKFVEMPDMTNEKMTADDYSYVWQETDYEVLFAELTRICWGKWSQIAVNMGALVSLMSIKETAYFMVEILLHILQRDLHPLLAGLFVDFQSSWPDDYRDKMLSSLTLFYSTKANKALANQLTKIELLLAVSCLVRSATSIPSTIFMQPIASSFMPTEKWTKDDDKLLVAMIWLTGYSSNDIGLEKVYKWTGGLVPSHSNCLTRIEEIVKNILPRFNAISFPQTQPNLENTKEIFENGFDIILPIDDQVNLVTSIQSFGSENLDEIKSVTKLNTQTDFSQIFNDIWECIRENNIPKIHSLLPYITPQFLVHFIEKTLIVNKARENLAKNKENLVAEDFAILTAVSTWGLESCHFKSFVIRQTMENSKLSPNAIRNHLKNVNSNITKSSHSKAGSSSYDDMFDLELPCNLSPSQVVHSLGQIIPKENYYNEDYIYPIGFSSSVTLVVNGRQENFDCLIKDDGEKPQFLVTMASHPTIFAQGTSPDDTWTIEIQSVRDSIDKEFLTGINGTPGHELFGLLSPVMMRFIQKLENANKLQNYRMKHFKMSALTLKRNKGINMIAKDEIKPSKSSEKEKPQNSEPKTHEEPPESVMATIHFGDAIRKYGEGQKLFIDSKAFIDISRVNVKDENLPMRSRLIQVLSSVDDELLVIPEQKNTVE